MLICRSFFLPNNTLTTGAIGIGSSSGSRSGCTNIRFIFIGYGLQDADLRALILEVDRDVQSRPRSYVVVPSTTDQEMRFWETRRIQVIPATGLAFLDALDKAVASPFRIATAVSPLEKHAIASRFLDPHSPLTPRCVEFLERDVDYVNAATSLTATDPISFYRGESPNWSAIEQKLDVRRRLTDTLLSDFVLPDDDDPTRDDIEVVVVKGHAGAGKSILIRRVAWDAAHDYGRLCMFLRPHAYLDSAAIVEIAERTNERMYLFVDDAVPRHRDLHTIVAEAGRRGIRMTLIVGVRANEWNVLESDFASDVTAEHELRYLSEPEIERLLDLLAHHHALGTLTGKTREEQRDAFVQRAGRQLLVALHEATLGKPFEEIVFDEYERIRPAVAQRIYLTICTLNRLGVPVRAGIVARIHGVSFERFRTEFLGPLEKIVHARKHPDVGDYVYEARHRHIAEIVFSEVLHDPEERFAEYMQSLQYLDVAYDSDFRAFSQMIRGRVLHEMFPNTEMVDQIFERALAIAPGHYHVLHQMAVYELIRQGGRLDRASSVLKEAEQKAPQNGSIKHSLAEVNLQRAQTARTELERETFLKAAMEAATEAARFQRGPHPYHTMVKVAITRLECALEDEEGKARLGA